MSVVVSQEFYVDFAHVAADESRHLGWCLQRLRELGHAYGDMVAHNQLWEGAQLSAGALLLLNPKVETLKILGAK